MLESLHKEVVITTARKGRIEDYKALLKDCWLGSVDLAIRDSFIPFRNWSGVMELAAKRLERPQFGIEWAQAMHPHFPNIGSAMLISHFSRAVSEWYQATITYFKYHSDGFSYHIIDEPENEFAIGRLTLDPFAFMYAGCSEAAGYQSGIGAVSA